VNAFHSISGLKTGKARNKTFIVVGVLAVLISLLIVVQPGIIGFTLFDTEAAQQPNNAPEWVSSKKTFRFTGEKTYDLNEYFKDADGDALTYLSTGPEGLGVKIDQSKITFTSQNTGTHKVAVVASDQKSTTKVRITVESQ